MKRIISGIMAMIMVFMLTACGNDSKNKDNKGITGETVTQSEFEGQNNGTKTLIAYFSYFDNTDGENITSKKYMDAMASASVTIVDGKKRGNNDVVADLLKKQTGADVFSIITKEKYSPDYDGGIVEQAQEDRRNMVKPELASHIENINQYDTVILLYPCWWYDMPMAVYTFFDEYDFTGKTIAPIVTSGGSGLLDVVDKIKQLEPGAKVTQGLAIYQTDVVNSESDITNWLIKTGVK